MIAALLLIAWADAALAQQAAPTWLRHALGSERWPSGLLLAPTGALAAVVVSLELARLLRTSAAGVESGTAILAALAGFFAVGLGANGVWTAAIVALLAALAMAWSLRGRQTSGAPAAVGAALLASIFVGGMLGVWLRVRIEDAVSTMLIGVVVVKASDIGAFFVGSAVGRRRLIVWLSPGKTWEGLAGGAVLAAAVAAGLAALAKESGWAGAFAVAPLWAAVIFGLLAALLGQASDLFASALKRAAGLKDAADLLPGFGGALDVTDSLLLTAPLAAAFVAQARALAAM